MAWDKSVPAGNTKLSIGDNGIRDNNDALEDALGEEHAFATGDTQTGRHRFPRGTIAQLTALSPAPENSTPGGSIGYSSIGLDMDARTNACLVYWDGSAWQYADNGTSDLPRTDENSNFTATQEFDWESVTVSGGTLSLDFSTQPGKYATIPASTAVTIANPTNGPAAGDGSTVYLQLTNAGTGSSISWGTAYRAPNGVAPFFDAGSGSVNIYTLTVMQTGAVLVTSAVNVSSF